MCFRIKDPLDPNLSVRFRKLASGYSDFKRTDRSPLVVEHSAHGHASIQGAFFSSDPGFLAPFAYVASWRANSEEKRLVSRIAEASKRRANSNQDPSFFVLDEYLTWEEIDLTQRRAHVDGTPIRTENGAIYYYPKSRGVFTTLEIDKDGSQWLITMTIQETDILRP